MKFYRRLSPIKAISFDLDDTLYANRPVMLEAERKMIQFFDEHFTDVHSSVDEAGYNYKFWAPYRQAVLEKAPLLRHDVVALRLETYYSGACAMGYSHRQAKQKAEQAMAYFSLVRSQFSVPESSHQLLKKLAQHYPLVSISNGNVDSEKINLKPYFQATYHAIGGIKQKPDGEMFALACRALKIKPAELLHVGDCGNADINGAIAAGCQAVWLPRYQIGKPLSVLPHIELDKVEDLAELLL